MFRWPVMSASCLPARARQSARRVHADEPPALEQIPAALEGTGLRLHRIKDKAKVNPVDLPKPLAQTITRLQTATSGLTATQASTLRRIVNGAQVFQRNIDKEEQLVLGALKNMGCVELDASAQYQPTQDLRLALPDLS